MGIVGLSGRTVECLLSDPLFTQQGSETSGYNDGCVAYIATSVVVSIHHGSRVVPLIPIDIPVGTLVLLYIPLTDATFHFIHPRVVVLLGRCE